MTFFEAVLSYSTERTFTALTVKRDVLKIILKL